MGWQVFGADPEDEEAAERLRKNFYHLWKPFQEARANPFVIREWERAPEGSEGWRNRIYLDQALRVLEVALRTDIRPGPSP